jgi:outer membrane receptor protein involved in Fe transport
MKSRFVFVWVLVVVILSSAALLSAQTFRGGIQGTVIDSTGATVPGAQMTVTNAGMGLSRTAQTNNLGNYSFSELPLGDYTVTATKPGFRTQTATGVQVTVAASQRVDLRLTAGQVTEKVEVTAEVPLVQNTSTSLGQTIEARQVSQLPINGRDYIKILELAPGANSDASGVSDSAGAFGQFSIDGNRGRSNNYLLDGTDINDGYRNDSAINEAGVFGTPATLLPIDALQEVAVLAGTEAEYGRNSGAIVNVVTKSGTNTVHGSAFEFFRNNWLDARNFFNAEPSPQSKFHNNQFGGSLGGPIVRDRTFFFVAYEGQRESVGIPTVVTIPTQADIATAGVPINPVIQRLLALNPFTAGQPLPVSNGNLTLNANGTNRLDSFIVKVDHHFHKSDVFTGRYYYGDSDQSFPLGLVGGSAVPGFNTVTPTRVQVVSLSLTHVFSPQLLLEVRGGYNRFFETFFPEDRNFDPNSIGLATTTNPQDFGLPLIKISGFSSIGSNASLPRGRVDTNWQYFTNISRTSGRHNWKFGYEFRRTFVNQFFDAGYRGVLSFDDLPSFLQGILSTTSTSRQATGDSKRGTFQNSHGLYVQDSYKLFPRLTLNYGLRWDYFGVLGEEKNRLSILNTNPTSGGLVFVGSPGLSHLYPKDWNNFSPRLGAAFDVFGTGKTVVRAGYTLAYDAFSQDFFAGQLPFNTFNPGPAYNPGGPSPILFTFSPVAVLASGVPVFPASGFSDSDVFTVDPNLRTPYVQIYSLNLQQQLGGHTAVQAGYVGSIGRKLFRYRDINQALPNNPARPFDNGPFAPSGGTFFYVNQFESTANSNYNSLQLSVNIRNLGGLSSTLNYTWSHSIDTASDGQDFVANAAQPDNSFNPGAERANSNFDVRNSFKWFFNYSFPKSSNRFLTGWGFDGVLAVADGQPYSLTYQFENDFNGSGEFFGRPDRVGDPFAGTSTPLQFLNLSAFQAPCAPDGTGGCAPGTQHFGNLRRNAFVGPNYRNFDFAVFKDTQIFERLNMQIRADFFNILNHPNFSNPVLPNFAVDFLTNGIDPATNRGTGFLPITATPDVGIGNPFLGGGGPRNIQLAVKFTF